MDKYYSNNEGMEDAVRKYMGLLPADAFGSIAVLGEPGYGLGVRVPVEAKEEEPEKRAKMILEKIAEDANIEPSVAGVLLPLKMMQDSELAKAVRAWITPGLASYGLAVRRVTSLLKKLSEDGTLPPSNLSRSEFEADVLDTEGSEDYISLVRAVLDADGVSDYLVTVNMIRFQTGYYEKGDDIEFPVIMSIHAYPRKEIENQVMGAVKEQFLKMLYRTHEQLGTGGIIKNVKKALNL